MESFSEICITLAGNKSAQIAAALKDARRLEPAVIEIRFDSLEKSEIAATLQIAEAAARSGAKILATFRPKSAGGLREISKQERIEFWRSAANRGFWGCDLEPEDLHLFPAETFPNVIVSFHSFDLRPSDLPLEEIFSPLASIPNAIVKIAAIAEEAADGAALWQLFSRTGHVGRKVIPIAMGEAGKWTRILAPAFGSPITYAALSSKSALAPGQIAAEDLLNLYRVGSLTRDTEIYGLLAGNTSYSLSPIIHNAAFAAAQMDRVFLPLQTANLGRFFAEIAERNLINIRGLAVTNPHKIDVIQYLDEIDESARIVGAVNTIQFMENRRIGLNTDLQGFIGPLLSRVSSLSSARIAVIGTGGAARSVAAALRREMAEISIFGRDVAKAESVAKAFGGKAYELNANGKTDFSSFDIVVNATPAGTLGPLSKVAIATADQLRGVRLVYDLVYNPPQTPLIRAAKEAGAGVIGGLEMLIRQAEAQFEIWAGSQPPAGVMEEAARRYFGNAKTGGAAE